MSDIVERLRDLQAEFYGDKCLRSDLEEAADEIERLRGLVVRAADFCDYETFNGERAEYGIRCCCGTRDWEPHRNGCEYGEEVARNASLRR